MVGICHLYPKFLINLRLVRQLVLSFGYSRGRKILRKIANYRYPAPEEEKKTCSAKVGTAEVCKESLEVREVGR
uniref:Uncharacterized protein LOC103419316 isoform X3 n=1 Tax=Rhizophora mucronata TaxID=61149 RepID=A0A2P2L5J4_RHIMU